MKNTQSLFGVLSIFVVLASCGIAGDAEARIGGGRSSGFRGSRNFAPRSAPVQPYNTAPQNSQSGFSGNNPSAFNSPMGGSGGLMRGMMAGVAGGFLGSMLARNFGNAAGTGANTSGGFGMLEMVLLAGIGFYVFRKFIQPRATAVNQAMPASMSTPMSGNLSAGQDVTEALRRYDASFDATRFKEERMDDFLKIQSSWNARDLQPVENLIAPEIRKTLEADIGELKRARQINKLENIAVRASDLVEGWQEGGKEYATLNFRAQLVDYTVDEDSQAVVLGNRTQPVKFEEEWTFVRDTHSPVSSMNPWKLSAISNV